MPLSVGPLYPGSQAQVSGGNPWTDASHIAAQDGVFASCAMMYAGLSDDLVAYNFDFSGIPGGSTITDFVVGIRRNCFASDMIDYVVDLGTYSGGGYSAASSNEASATVWPTSPATETYGVGMGLWGTGWTLASLDSTTAVRLICTTGMGDTAAVDVIHLTVYYTFATPDYFAAHAVHAGRRHAGRGMAAHVDRASYLVPAASASAPTYFAGDHARPAPPPRSGRAAGTIVEEYVLGLPAGAVPTYFAGVHAAPPRNPKRGWVEYLLPGALGGLPPVAVPVYAAAEQFSGRAAGPAAAHMESSVTPGVKPAYHDAAAPRGSPVLRGAQANYLGYSLYPRPTDLPPSPLPPCLAVGRGLPGGHSVLTTDLRLTLTLPPGAPDATALRGAAVRRAAGAAMSLLLVRAETADLAPSFFDATVTAARPALKLAAGEASEPIRGTTGEQLPREQHALAAAPRRSARTTDSRRERSPLDYDGEAAPSMWGHQILAAAAAPPRHLAAGSTAASLVSQPDSPPLPCPDSVRPHPGWPAGRGRGVEAAAPTQAPARIEYVDTALAAAVAPAGKGDSFGQTPLADSAELLWRFAAANSIVVDSSARSRPGAAWQDDYAGRPGAQDEAANLAAIQSQARSEVTPSRRAPRRGEAGATASYYGVVATSEDGVRGWTGGGVSLPRQLARPGRHTLEWVADPQFSSDGGAVGMFASIARPHARIHARCGGGTTFAAPDWHGAGLIRFAGPGYAAAGCVYYAGAQVGTVVEG